MMIAFYIFCAFVAALALGVVTGCLDEYLFPDEEDQ